MGEEGKGEETPSSPLRVTATATSDADFATGLIQSSISRQEVYSL